MLYLYSSDRIFTPILFSPTHFFFTAGMFQVADGRGNCTPHRNPTPCTIPQDKESIFHSIFAFFTKSGRKVLVKTLWHFRGHGQSPPVGILHLFFSQGATSVHHTSFSLPHILLPALSLSSSPCLCFFFFFEGLWPAWKSMHDNFLQSGSTVKRRGFEHRHKTSAQHRNSQEGKKNVRSLMNSGAAYCVSERNSNRPSLNHRIVPQWSSLWRGAVCKSMKRQWRWQTACQRTFLWVYQQLHAPSNYTDTQHKSEYIYRVL